MLHRSKWLRSALALLLLLIVGAIISVPSWRAGDEIVWSMVHVSGKKFSGDAHLLEFPDGRFVLIDTGFDRFTRRDLIPYLDDRGVRRLHRIVVTHAHRNHYGGVARLIQHMDAVEAVVFNLPARAACDAETWSTGCDYGHVLQTREHIAQLGVPLHRTGAGDTLFEDRSRNIYLRVVYTHDGQRPPIGRTDINDTSLVMRLSYGGQTVLFSGDINVAGGRYLVDQGLDLKAVILTAPHHGVESAAGNDFLDRIGAEMAMVSNSWGHWTGDRGRRMREYFAENDMPVYVTGRDGVVTVRLRPDGYAISTQRDGEINH